MAEAMTTPKNRKAQVLAMTISFLLALPLAAILLLHPSLMLDANGHYNSLLMLVMIGISGGFVHGVGFVPRFWLWKWLFSPYIAWPLMVLGYFIWLGQ